MAHGNSNRTYKEAENQFWKETPRTAVIPVNQVRQQMIEQIELWLAQSLKVRAEANKGKVHEADEDDKNDCAGPGGTIDLLGKWKTEPLCLPPA
ncbi:hypothetical protein Tco_0272729 [Tanacetum coccineum]